MDVKHIIDSKALIDLGPTASALTRERLELLKGLGLLSERSVELVLNDMQRFTHVYWRPWADDAYAVPFTALGPPFSDELALAVLLYRSLK